MRILLAVSLIILGTGFSVSGQEHSRPPGVPPGTANSTNTPRDNSGWTKFISEKGRFSVLMPGVPTDKTETVQSEHGPYTTHLFILREPHRVFLIGYVDYDPSFNFNRQSELEANRDNFVKGLSARLVETHATMIDGYSAIEFIAETPERIFKSRVYMVGRRPYQIVIGLARGEENSLDVTKFFNSFKVSP
jgi:hypothetical protein